MGCDGDSGALTPNRLSVPALITIILFAIGTLGGIMISAGAWDKVMEVHALLFSAFCLGGIVWIGNQAMQPAESGYMEKIIQWGTVVSMFWGVVGFTVGLVIALQLAWPVLNFDTSFLNFGRMRPLHTSAVIFAFGGNVLLVSSFYVVQRTCKARLFGGGLAWFVFWGYQLFILMAATGYLMGSTSGKEYAEPEWFTDLWLTIVWVAYLIVFLGTVMRREEPHIYVANWFYLGFIVTIAMLHIGNNMAIPLSIYSSESVILWSGVQDALIQWWYGHNAVGFFLTAGFLAIMYYFIPKAVNRPVYSYRLSIIHFWSLIFMYIWAGPHHLHYTALPDWSQTLGMVFSVMLWMPSWGGMINGLMTLSGVWDKLRTDPVVRMMVVSLAFYGMSTFEGPVMSIKAVNSLSHYTEWTVGHVHSGALGWVGYISFGAIYCLAQWAFGRKQLYSNKLVEWHFWVSTIGIALYVSSLWVAGITQGLMWRAYDSLGFLQYSFVESVEQMHIYYIIRALGGGLFVVGSLIMAWNVYKTIKGDVAKGEELPDAAPVAAE